ncbi:DNA polymerase III subunit alpha [Methylotetracoccus oryzae]|uniref:DNA polymerase III subunit alpha n=1 Tax=Methylotetracoccus oryzae TaxID=1919059 RepID=UPI001117DB41|nr:DNA polymerase III subunit alpha [Methylotetracoccus oryzae]
MQPRFIHLRVHTEYSLSDGLPGIGDLVARVAELGMPAVAISDQSNLFALVKFYKAALKRGVKPIVGADLWVLNEAEPGSPDRLSLFVQNAAGYRNLVELISKAYLEHQRQGIPMLMPQWLPERSEGLLALSGGREGRIGRLLLSGNVGEARRELAHWQRVFGDRYYLELQRTGRTREEEYIDHAVLLAEESGAPVVATNDVRFLRRGDFDAHEARVCIHQGRVLEDPRRPRDYSPEQYLRSPDEMAEQFADLPVALENTVEFAKRCNLELTLGQTSLPDFPVPEGMHLDDYFAVQSRTGLEQRLVSAGMVDNAATAKVYRDRLELELAVIRQMGFPGYFLIVADFIQWAKSEGIPVGPGRGSGAGSLVAYALQITDLDPLEFDLLFERFLNPERVSMPDFDIDFCMERRDEVIDYVARKYGRDRVSQIITYGSMAAKAVVRDVGRVLGHSYGFVDKIAKLIPFELGITLDKALNDSEDLRRWYESDEEVRALIDLAKSLEGLTRNPGKHAGGLVIAPSRLTDYTPLYCDAGGDNLVTQFDKDDVEAVGLVKFDFLGLRTLTIIDWALKTINRTRAARGESPVDIAAIPRDDPKTYELLKRYATTAVFQLESRGMKDLIKRLQPDCFEDIVALVALFRPGPLQSGMVDDFINRKQGRAKVEYPHPLLENILKPTYGVIVYQEQVMQIAQVLAGYSLGEADLLRRAMGKKKPEEMAKQRGIFVSGATARKVDESVASFIFDLMEKFAEYGFNKSHSAAYALVSYQTAWLKAHYPAEFMAAVLSADMDNTDKVVVLIEECRQMGLTVLSPDVNRSEHRFTVKDPGTILYGLGAVKGVGASAIGEVVEERERNGAFVDLVDLCRRIDLRKVNRRVLEALIRAGALDSLEANRAALLVALPEAMRVAEQHLAMDAMGQDDLFGLHPATVTGTTTLAIAPVEPWTERERLAHEKSTLGLYLTGHPITEYEAELAAIISSKLGAVSLDGHRGSGRQEVRVVVAGLVVELRTRQSKSGKRMAFATLDDRTGRVEVAVFSEAFDQSREALIKDALVVVEGTLALDDFTGQTRLSAERVHSIEAARARFARQLVIDWPVGAAAAPDAEAGRVGQLRAVLKPFQGGGCPIVIDYRGAGAETRLQLGAEWRVRPAEDLLQRLKKTLGPDRVRLLYN